jgi:hypothetical protein
MTRFLTTHIATCISAFTLIAVCGCATYRPRGDAEIESLLGVRTMSSTACIAVNDCIKAAVQAAQRDCGPLRFEYVSHSTRNTYLNGRMATVTYRCGASSRAVPSVGTTSSGRRPLSPGDGGAKASALCTEADIAAMREARMSESAIETACKP